MNGSVNHWQLIGRVGRGIELRHTARGPVASFSVGTDYYRLGEGEKRERATDWHRCFAFADRALQLARELKRGDLVYVAGPATTSSLQREGVTIKEIRLRVEGYRHLARPSSQPAGEAAGAADAADAGEPSAEATAAALDEAAADGLNRVEEILD